jgi:hypothetical protein
LGRVIQNWGVCLHLLFLCIDGIVTVPVSTIDKLLRRNFGVGAARSATTLIDPRTQYGNDEEPFGQPETVVAKPVQEGKFFSEEVRRWKRSMAIEKFLSPRLYGRCHWIWQSSAIPFASV